MHRVTVLPQGRVLEVCHNRSLMEVLKEAGIFLDAPCGGKGTCGKCRVLVNGVEHSACRTRIDRDMTVLVPEENNLQILSTGAGSIPRLNPRKGGYMIAIDLGTTSVVCFLLDGKTGRELASASMLNPQNTFGADVISRIQASLQGHMDALKRLIRDGIVSLIRAVCRDAHITPEEISLVSLVGNPAMQQLFLGISPENLAAVPFEPVLTRAEVLCCSQVLPCCPGAELLIVPDISGYVGADTLGCVLATGMDREERMTLLVDIGTNGEMVLGNRDRMIACSAAAGPALEGANIRFGMRAVPGAIDHVWLQDGALRCSVIGGGDATGICGSGLIDAVAAGLESGLINKRGRILNEEHIFPLTDRVFLTQEDIRQVQLAKGAISAGIQLMAETMGIRPAEIDRVLLAGAFGSFLLPESACRTGLLPEELADKITAVGNAAGSGAKLLALDRDLFDQVQALRDRIAFLELASLPAFPRTFARAMNFREADR